MVTTQFPVATCFSAPSIFHRRLCLIFHWPQLSRSQARVIAPSITPSLKWAVSSSCCRTQNIWFINCCNYHPCCRHAQNLWFIPPSTLLTLHLVVSCKHRAIIKRKETHKGKKGLEKVKGSGVVIETEKSRLHDSVFAKGRCRNTRLLLVVSRRGFADKKQQVGN